MTLPTRSKTWEIAKNLRSHIDTDSAEQTNKGLALLIKNTLIGFTNNPWVVESSCDSAAAGNNDQVDRWLDTGDIVNSVGAHSWYVLKCPVTGQQYCFDCNDSTSAMRDATITWSPSVGYGVANGGGDGTTTARPTATDEITMISSLQWSPGETFAQHSTLHCWRSTDGECTRVVMMRTRQCWAYWDFSMPRDPVAGWSPAQLGSASRGAGRLSYGVMNDLNTAWDFRHTAVGAGNFHIGTVGTLSAGVLENEGGRVNHAVNDELQMVPPVLACNQANLGGLYGTLHDWYWGTDAFRAGTVQQDDEAWVLIDDVWLPWELDTVFQVS